MKKNKDISHIFQTNQHKLNEQPSLRTWRRIEQRLDKRNQPNLIRMLSMVAALVALVVVISVISIMVSRQDKLSANLEATPVYFEELSSDVTPAQSHMIEEFQKAVKDRASFIEEGEPGKRLVPKKH